MSDKEKQENLLAMRAMNEFNLDDDDTSRFDYCFLVLSTLKEETFAFQAGPRNSCSNFCA